MSAILPVPRVLPGEAEYDDVLAKYSAWLVTLRDKGYTVVDPGTVITTLSTASIRRPR